jgi:hypothetical protein
MASINFPYAKIRMFGRDMNVPHDAVRVLEIVRRVVLCCVVLIYWLCCWGRGSHLVCLQEYGANWFQTVSFKGIKKMWCSNVSYGIVFLVFMVATVMLGWPLVAPHLRDFVHRHKRPLS